MGAGILPVSLYRGTLYLLLGQERHTERITKQNKHLWCDFGGGSHRGETNPFNTALREGQEELNGFLGVDEDLKDNVTANMILSMSYDKYTTYIFNIKYNKELPLYFSNMNKFAEKYLTNDIDNNHNGLFEKITIKWFPIDELKNPKMKELIRPHYKAICESIIKNEKLLIKEIEKLSNITSQSN